jgi:SET family sugar efflux transporter-like MFS transporter
MGSYGIAIAIFATTTSLFLATAIHVGPLLIGVYFVGRALFGICANLIGGWASDRIADRRAALTLTSLAGVVGAICFMLMHNYAAVLVTGVVFFSLNSVCFSQVFAYAKEFAEAARRNVASFSSALRSVFSASWVVGPPAGLYLITRVGFGPVYAGCAALFLLTALLARWRLPALPPQGQVGTPGAVHRREIRAAFAVVPRRAWLLLGAVTAVLVADQIYLIVIALYVTKDLRLTASLAGIMTGTCAALEIPFMIVVGRFADRIGQTRIVAVAIMVAVGFFSLLPAATSVPALLALQVANAAWTAVLVSIPLVMVQHEVPSGPGGASALYTCTFMTAELLAGAIAGPVAAVAGYRNVFWACAVLCAIAMAMFLCRARSHPIQPLGH